MFGATVLQEYVKLKYVYFFLSLANFPVLVEQTQLVCMNFRRGSLPAEHF
jgi:hypothetical protein